MCFSHGPWLSNLTFPLTSVRNLVDVSGLEDLVFRAKELKNKRIKKTHTQKNLR